MIEMTGQAGNGRTKYVVEIMVPIKYLSNLRDAFNQL